MFDYKLDINITLILDADEWFIWCEIILFFVYVIHIYVAFIVWDVDVEGEAFYLNHSQAKIWLWQLKMTIEIDFDYFDMTMWPRGMNIQSVNPL